MFHAINKKQKKFIHNKKPLKMKNLSFFLTIFLPLFSFAQVCDFQENYSSSAGWTIADLDNNGNIQTAQRITINGGTLNFVNSPDGRNITRAFRNLENNLCDSWVADFEFTPTAVSNSNRSAGPEYMTKNRK